MRALVFALLFGSALAGAQSAAAQPVVLHREVPRGEITGLEMAIDGALSGPAGATLRWYVTLYEVVGRRELRPSAGSELRATASFARGEPIFTVRTDANGRAALELPLPAAMVGSAHLVIEATSPRNVRRSFDVDLEIEPAFTLALVVDRASGPPGGSVLAFGRVMATRTGLPAVDQEVVLEARTDVPVQPPVTLRTDAAGFFSLRVQLPVRGESLRILARTEGAYAELPVALVRPVAPRLLVSAAPESRVVTPGSVVPVTVSVRTPSGAPIARAVVEGLPRPAAPPSREPLPPIRTDARGMATVPWQLPLDGVDAPFADLTGALQVTVVGVGSESAEVRVRTSRRAFFGALAIEGGALVPELPGRVFARVVSASGAPLASESVELDAPRLGGVLRGTTDAEGVVAFVVPRVGESVADACGGPTATEVTLRARGESESVCLAVDPDAPMTVHLDTSAAMGAPLTVELARRPALASAAVELTVLRERAAGWEPIARTLAPGGARTATIPLPEGTRGVLWVRARPRLDSGQTVRGAGALVWVHAPALAEPRTTVDARGAAMSWPETGTRFVFALPETTAAPPLEALLSPTLALEGHGALYVAAELARDTPADAAASAVLRDGELVPQAMPEEAVRLGLLRDPWRTRARFVRGRIGRLMRAVEAYVDARLPAGLDEVAVRTATGWEFNREMLAAAMEEASLGDEHAASLDGEPLDIAALSALDPAFRYDTVARRLTRARLWRVLRVVHRIARERWLDLAWARRGDPRTWIQSLPEVATDDGEVLTSEELFDAWGHPFVLRPVRGVARFTFLPPIPGYELVSVGPDGREGTTDDLGDPFARAVPAGSVYAEAVGEDALVARLTSVALGRATVETLGTQLELDATDSWDAGATAEPDLGDDLPPPLAPSPALRAYAEPLRDALGGLVRDDHSEPFVIEGPLATYQTLSLGLHADGRVVLARAPFDAGVEVSTELVLPGLLRPGEQLRVPLSVVPLRDGLSVQLALEPVEGGAISASLTPPTERGALRVAQLTVQAHTMGRAVLRVRVLDAGGTTLSVITRTLRVLPTGRLQARHAIERVEAQRTLTAGAPSGAVPVRSTLVLAAPRHLSGMPDFAELSPAVRAWAETMERGHTSDALLTRVESGILSGTGTANRVEAACSLVAVAASQAHVHLVGVTARQVDDLPADLRARAAVLVALAATAPGVASTGGDTASRVATTLRADGWRALGTERDSPAVMARLAAGLLLLDRQDAPGLALLELAERALVAEPDGHRTLPGDPTIAGDGLLGTLALAIAARQAGDDALADELATSVAPRLYLLPRLGTEGVFWALAASVYGGLGGEREPTEVDVRIDGTPQRVALVDGVAVLTPRPGAAVSVTADAPVFAALSQRYVTDGPRREDTRLQLQLEGNTGLAGERAGLELLVTTTEAVDAPVLELQLPAASELDASARAALASTPGVTRVHPTDAAGVVRIELAPLRATATLRLGLGFRWLGDGHVLGPGVVAYDADAPESVTTLDPTFVDLTAQPTEPSR